MNKESEPSPQEQSSWCVVFDTSVLNQDPRLRSRGPERLFLWCSQASVSLYLPSVVLKELIAHFLEDLENAGKKADRALKRLGRFDYKDHFHEIALETETLAKDYTAWLKNKLEALDIKILDDPTVPHAVVVDRAINRRRPFTTQDSGPRQRERARPAAPKCSGSERG